MPLSSCNFCFTSFCRSNGLYYLSLRLWIGVWTAIILLILVAFDASAFVCYITRFTEENFATLISVIFIYKAIEKVGHLVYQGPITRDWWIFLFFTQVLQINTNMPMNTDLDRELDYTCYCSYNTTRMMVRGPHESNKTVLDYCVRTLKGHLEGEGCNTPVYVPNVFLFAVICFIATYVISVTLKECKTAPFFPTKVRQFFSDFAVVIAIVLMTVVDNWVGLPTPKLLVPEDFKVFSYPSLPGTTLIILIFCSFSQLRQIEDGSFLSSMEILGGQRSWRRSRLS